MPKPWEPEWNGKDWQIDFYVQGRRIRRRLGIRDFALKSTARRQAQRIYEAEWQRDHAPKPEGTPFYIAADAYIRQGGEARFLPKLMVHFGKDALIEDIDEVEIVAAGAALYPNAAPETVRRQVRVPILAVIRFAKGKRREKRQDNARTRWLTPEEAEKLLQCAGRAGPMIAYLLGTGCRTGEMFALDVADLNPATRQAWIADPKNGEGRWVTVEARAWQLMGDLPDVGAVFRTPKGLPYKQRQGGGGQMAAAFNKARDLAGLGPDVTPHVMRHTWATWYYAATKDFGGLMDLGGWKKADMANRYRKLAPADLAARLAAHGWSFGQDLVNFDRRAVYPVESKG
ncbi:MAG: site-specific integrase [Pseudomonadota bacterium]